MFSLSYSPQVKAQNYNPCSEDPCPEREWEPDKGAFITFPQFPGCIIEVRWRFKRCPDPNTANYYEITNYSISQELFPNACAALHTWLRADPLHVNEVYEYAITQVAVAMFDLLRHDGIIPLGYCPDGFVSYTTRLAACNTFCYYEDFINAKMTIVPKKCNSTHCCKVTIKNCIDEATQQTITTKTVESLGIPGECTSSIEPCPAYISRPNLTGGGSHLVPFDSSDECVPSSCQAN